MHINFSKRTYSKSRRPVFHLFLIKKNTHSPFSSKNMYSGGVILSMRSLHVWDKQIKAVSPLLQQVINISSMVGLGSLIFCIWGLSGWDFRSGKPFCLYPAGRYLGPPLFIFFLQILQTVVPIIPGALTSVAGVFIYGHIIGTIYNISAS